MAPTLTPDLASAGYDDEHAVRTRVALRVLHIVASFAGDSPVSDELRRGDLTGLDADEHGSVALAAEQEIRRLADSALSRTDAGGQVVSAALSAEYLLDDFLRIRAVEQHLAFGEERTEVEDDHHQQWLRDQDEERLVRAERTLRWQREDARLCTCGETYGRHRRDTSREQWLPRDTGVCRRFRNVDELPGGGVTEPTFRAGWRAWLTSRGLENTAADVELTNAAVAALRQHRGTGGPTLGELYAAYAATSASMPPGEVATRH